MDQNYNQLRANSNREGGFEWDGRKLWDLGASIESLELKIRPLEKRMTEKIGLTLT